MPSIREQLEAQEELVLHPRATRSRLTRGRVRPEEPCAIRPAFQHDRDRVLHSKSFRRLKHKTQVFLSPAGDHYRTRLTHTLEVSQIARTIARCLCLNESLVEAISLAHDLGHTPFGHAGEAVLNRLHPGGFHHAVQSLRVVDRLERDGLGLNLCAEVRDGIRHHTKGKGEIHHPDATLEAQVVRVSDLIAYLNHDVDDALRAGVIRRDQIPQPVCAIMGATHGQRIDAMVRDVVHTTLGCEVAAVRFGADMHKAVLELRDFLYQQVYENPAVHDDFIKASKLLEELYEHFVSHGDWFRKNLAQHLPDAAIDDLAADFIAGMTDRYALALYNDVFIPQPWRVR